MFTAKDISFVLFLSYVCIGLGSRFLKVGSGSGPNMIGSIILVLITKDFPSKETLLVCIFAEQLLCIL